MNGFTGTIENGHRVKLTIAGVFDGMAGRVGRTLSFIPDDRRMNKPGEVSAILDEKPVRLRITRPADYDSQTRPFLDATVIG